MCSHQKSVSSYKRSRSVSPIYHETRGSDLRSKKATHVVPQQVTKERRNFPNNHCSKEVKCVTSDQMVIEKFQLTKHLIHLKIYHKPKYIDNLKSHVLIFFLNIKNINIIVYIDSKPKSYKLNIKIKNKLQIKKKNIKQSN